MLLTDLIFSPPSYSGYGSFKAALLAVLSQCKENPATLVTNSNVA